MTTATVTLRSRSRLADTVRSESTKLWTVRSSWLNIVSALVLTALLGVQFGLGTAYDAEQGQILEPRPVGEFGISVVLILQVLVAAFALLTVTSEYATGAIRSTLQWTPVRRNVVLAKAVVLTPVLFLYGLVLAAIAAIAGGLTAGSWADWDAGSLVTDLVSVAFYLTAAGLFAAGIAWIIRSTAGTLTAAFLLLMVLPLMLSQSTLRPLIWTAALLPGGAGQNFLTNTTDPLTPTLSAIVLATWVAVALVLGARTLYRRDA
ncbi:MULTISPECIES: ABC transporter permease [unclassified Kribbella]|uniref:ABC transporter permease n=1 Tax=unclassified Kribbella TaxID=2644121 RepID=UPI00301B11A3